MTINRHGVLRDGIVASAVVVALLAIGSLVLRGTDAVFNTRTNNPASGWTSGTVALAYNGTASALFPSTLMTRNTPLTNCIRVDYQGDVAASVRLYTAASSDTTAVSGAPAASHPFGEFVNLKIEQSATNGDCASFGTGSTVYDGPLSGTSGFTSMTAYASGVGGWAPTGTAADRFKAYRFTVTLAASAPAEQQGGSTTVTFAWEATAGS
jgi:hypothetical protein